MLTNYPNKGGTSRDDPITIELDNDEDIRPVLAVPLENAIHDCELLWGKGYLKFDGVRWSWHVND